MDVSHILDPLNDAQRQAVSAPAGPVLWLNHDIVARQLNQLHA